MIGIKKLINNHKSLKFILLIILVVLGLLSLFSCYSVKYIKPDVPDLNLIELEPPNISKDSDSWNNQEFVDVVNYSLQLKIQLNAYKEYIKSLGSNENNK